MAYRNSTIVEWCCALHSLSPLKYPFGDIFVAWNWIQKCKTMQSKLTKTKKTMQQRHTKGLRVNFTPKCIEKGIVLSLRIFCEGDSIFLILLLSKFFISTCFKYFNYYFNFMMALNFDNIYLFIFLGWVETMRNDEKRQFCVIKKTSYISNDENHFWHSQSH
jgi:hypothetical protein